MAKQESVLVVGGGIIGIACAHYLRDAGMKVTVIDRGQFGGACSYGNCGYVCPSHVLPLTEPGAIETALKSMLNPRAPFRVKPQFRFSLWYWMLQFARRCRHENMLQAGQHLKAILDSSMNEYRQLVVGDGIQAEWKNSGLLYVLRTEKGMDGFAKTDAVLRKYFDTPAERIDRQDLTEFEPALRSDLAGGFFYPDDAQVRPDKLTRQWVEKLQDEGVRLISDCALQKILPQGKEIFSVLTTQGEMMADRYVFAMGAWSQRLGRELKCPIPIEPGKGYSVTMRRPEVCPKHSILFPEHKVGVTPFDEGYRLGSMMEFAGFDDSIAPQRIQQLKDSAKPYLLEPYTDGPAEEWYGWRPMTWDSLPLIGQVPHLANAYLATGHNMLGLSLAPGTGRLIKELICGESTHIPSDGFRPERMMSGVRH